MNDETPPDILEEDTAAAAPAEENGEAESDGAAVSAAIAALGVDEAFIGSLARLAVEALQRGGVCPGSAYACRGWRKCPRTEMAA